MRQCGRVGRLQGDTPPVGPGPARGRAVVRRPSTHAASTPGGDSRNDPAYSVQNPPGNATAKDAQGFHLATEGLDTYGAASTDGARNWSLTRLSTETQMPNYEMFGDRQVPFHGDYNYISNVRGFAYGTWTDTREVRPGSDPVQLRRRGPACGAPAGSVARCLSRRRQEYARSRVAGVAGMP